MGVMHSAESLNNRALIRSSPIALLVFKIFNCLRTKDSVILQKENDLFLFIFTTNRNISRLVQVISRNQSNVSKPAFVTPQVLYCSSRNQLSFLFYCLL